MFERYTERARRVLFFARYEASQLGNVSIEVEHVLLGLLRERKGITTNIFAAAHISFEAIRLEIEKGMTFHEKISTSVEIPFTPACKRVLQFAAQEADGLNHRHIGSEHLLLGILREEQSSAAKTLMRAGVSLTSARGQIVELLALHPKPVPEPSGDTPTFEAAADRFEVFVTVASYTATGGTRANVGPRHWIALGHSFKGLIAEIFDVDEKRVEGPVVDHRRFDCGVVVPRPEDPEILKGLARDAVQRFFGVSLERRDRSVFITRSDSKP